MFQNSFHKARIILIPRPDKDERGRERERGGGKKTERTIKAFTFQQNTANQKQSKAKKKRLFTVIKLALISEIQ